MESKCTIDLMIIFTVILPYTKPNTFSNDIAYCMFHIILLLDLLQCSFRQSNSFLFIMASLEAQKIYNLRSQQFQIYSLDNLKPKAEYLYGLLYVLIFDIG